MVFSELYKELEACREKEVAVFECWVDGASIQVSNHGGFFCRVALPGCISTCNDQLAPLLRLVAASLAAGEPVALAYDSRHQRACLVHWLKDDADTGALVDAVESLANHQAAWALVLAEQAAVKPAFDVSLPASLGIGLVHRGLTNG